MRKPANTIWPTPWRVKYTDQIKLSCSTPIGILSGPELSPAECHAVGEFRAAWKRLGGNCILADCPEKLRRCAGVIVVGTIQSNPYLDALCRKYRIKLSSRYPGDQGYMLRFEYTAEGWTVICGGSDSTGVWFGIQSLIQLCRRQGVSLLIQSAQVDDRPAIAYRGMFTATKTGGILLARYKFNSFDISYLRHGFKWRNPAAKYRRLVESMTNEALKRGLMATCYVNPLYCKNWKYGGDRDKIVISRERDIQALYRTFKLSLDKGARAICLALDDFTSAANILSPGYFLTEPADRHKFGHNPGRAHFYLAQRIYDLMKRDYPTATLMVIPAYYSGSHGTPSTRAEYLTELGKLPKDVVIQWTGPQVRSLTIKETHFRQYARLIKRPPAYFDNTIYAVHHPRPNATRCAYYLFDLYAQGYYPEFARQTGWGVHANGSVEGVVNEAGILQIADYLWNPEAYRADYARQQALEITAGRGMAPLLVRFNDVFKKLHDRTPCLWMKNADPHMFMDHETWRETRRLLGELQEVMRAVEQKCPRTDLVAELRERFFEPVIGKAGSYCSGKYVKRQLAQKLPEGILFPWSAFQGGDPKFDHLFGRPSPLNKARALFYLNRLPRHDVLLGVKAADAASAGLYQTALRMRVSINSHAVYEGPADFKEGDFVPSQVWPVKRAWLKKGRNVLQIENMEQDFCRCLKVMWAKLILVP